MNLGIYIHLPYCLTKCPYCDFNSYGVGEDYPEDEYTEALIGEIGLCREYLAEKNVSSVFFGGGTPSLFSPDNISKILDELGKYARFKPDTEITLEINPRTANLEKLKGFYDSGINRASIGIQSFSQRKLDFYGRNCKTDDCIKAIEDVINAGFRNFNIDLIYGSSNESVEELRADLEMSVGYGSTHLSAYCLTIEDGTQFGYLYKKGMLKLPEDKLLREMYYITSEVLEESGLKQYEISNFSKPGNECIQNLGYWNCETYIGFGAGAHSHLRGGGEGEFWGKRWGNVKNPGGYIKKVSEQKVPLEFEEILDRRSSLMDRIIMGLRLSEGVKLDILESEYNTKIDKNSIDYLFQDGLIDISDNKLRITPDGRIYSNLLIEKITEAAAL